MTSALDTVTVRAAVRVLGVGMLVIVFAAGVALGSDSGSAHGAPDAHAGNATEARLPNAPVYADLPDAAERILYFTNMGRERWKEGDRVAAERAFSTALNVNVDPALKRDLMLELGGLYEEAKDSLRALAVLEKFRVTFPNDRETAGILLRLGLLHREVGALSTASTHFFQVLNSTLRVEEGQFPAYKKLAMKARFEIAETYALQGNFEEARRYFSRLEVLELSPADRERVVYRGAQLLHAQEQWVEAERQLAVFITEYPSSVAVPEARYMRAKSLEKLQRREEAVQEVVALLKSQESVDPAQLAQSSYWKRRTGNELANQFYEQGDITGALAIYQAIAGASEEPTWRWPAVYQIGLCFERLNLPERAEEAYKVILDSDASRAGSGPLPKSLASIQSMAKWRLEHLDWVEEFGKRLQGYSVEQPADS